jgi:PPM family protein phosphatase
VSRPTGHTRGTDAVRGRASDESEAEYRASGTVALSAVRPRAQPIDEEEERPHAPPAGPAPRRRRGLRRLFSPGKLIAFGSLVGLLAAFWLATRQVYFVGVDESRGNVVTLYHGLPYDLPLGIELYSPVRHSGVTFEQVPANRRGTFTDHKLRSKDDAESLVLALEQGRIQ